MSGTTPAMDGTSVAITDPGEIDRHEHIWADRLMIQVSNVVAWLLPILMLAIVAQVFMRQAGFNQAWLDDAQWWMYGFAMLTGFAYAITTNSHVRVDILHQNFSVTKKARVEVFAIGWFLMPFLFVMTDILMHYAWSSILAREGSDSPNGLHHLYLLKSSLPIMFVMAGVAAWGIFYRNLSRFTVPTALRQLLWALPAVWFVCIRLCHYTLYWVVYFTNDEIVPRRIPREPIFDYTVHMGLAVVAVLLILSFILRRKSAQEI